MVVPPPIPLQWHLPQLLLRLPLLLASLLLLFLLPTVSDERGRYHRTRGSAVAPASHSWVLPEFERRRLFAAAGSAAGLEPRASSRLPRQAWHEMLAAHQLAAAENSSSSERAEGCRCRKGLCKLSKGASEENAQPAWEPTASKAQPLSAARADDEGGAVLRVGADRRRGGRTLPE
ncbi:hypothetical protein T484DRAFT_1817081 [Baffinella frigidus]|nr:hypothetical protein T484DRAFT_1817081 [Cryptophyta sp. CCMP2293]